MTTTDRRLYLPIAEVGSGRTSHHIDGTMFEIGYWADSNDSMESARISLDGICLIVYNVIPSQKAFNGAFPQEMVIIFDNNRHLLNSILELRTLPNDNIRNRMWFLVRPGSDLSETAHILASLGFQVVIRLGPDVAADIDVLREQILKISLYSIREKVAHSPVQPIIARLLLNQDPGWSGPAGCLGGPSCLFQDSGGNLKMNCFDVHPDSGSCKSLDELHLRQVKDTAARLESFKTTCGCCVEYPLCRGMLLTRDGGESGTCSLWREVGGWLDKINYQKNGDLNLENVKPFEFWKDRWLHMGPLT